jgi:hypothetical protein
MALQIHEGEALDVKPFAHRRAEVTKVHADRSERILQDGPVRVRLQVTIDEFSEGQPLGQRRWGLFDLAASLDEGDQVGPLSQMEEALVQEHQRLFDATAQGFGDVAGPVSRE